VLFLASNRVIQPIDLEQHGLFTQVILDGLKGAADKEGYEPDGVVTVDELMEYLEKESPPLVRKYGKTKEEKEQMPVVVGVRSSHFVLTKNPAVAGKVQDRLDKFAKLVEENQVSKEFAAEGKNLLSQMPKLEAQRSLRKKYQELADGKLTAADFDKERTKILDNTKLKRSTALEFASKIIDATEKIQKEYVKDLKQEDLVVWAIKGLYRRIEEKPPADIKERMDQAKDMGEKELTALLADVRQRLGKREDLDSHKDLDIALVEMLHNHTDPYTTYIDAESKRQFEQDMTGRLFGIGVQIRKDSATDMLLVVTPIKDSPAYKAHPLNMEVSQGEIGLKAGDIITKVVREVDSEGKPLDKPETLSTKGMLLNDAVKKIKGKAGTKVRITVQRKGFDKPLDFEITRDQVEIESVVGVKRMEDDTWDYMIDPESRIAYIRLNAFTQTTAPTLLRLNQKKPVGLLPTLTRKGIKGLILDLRFNPGGLLGSAVGISDMFIDDGLIVTIRDRAGHEEPHIGNHDLSYLNFPMVCLVNGYSASGSEIVAACLQDHHRALIVGERSYGKGSVQNVQSFDDGELKITIASFWRPSNKNLNKSSTSGKDDDEWGVMPDKGYLVKLSRKERDELLEYQKNQEIIPRRDLPAKEEKSEFKDRQLEKALEYLRGQIKTAGQLSSKKAG
jgi:C-terminal peptidase prc